ncbi:endonuclease/exonuclease/phosphatase family protein, partial [Streptomyces sp. NPDC059409]
MTDWAAWTGGRGRVLAGAAVVTALLLSFHGAVPNRVGGLGSLLESFLPWLGAVVAVLFLLAVVRRSAFALVALLLPAAAGSEHFGGVFLPGPAPRAPGPGGGERNR